MPDFGTLKSYIADEFAGEVAVTDSIVGRAIIKAIGKHEHHRFLFNEGTQTISTVAGTADYTLTTSASLNLDYVQLEIVQLQYNATRVPLTGPLDWVAFDTLETRVTPNRSRPIYWNYSESKFRLWPMPDAVYVIELKGLLKYATLSASGDSNGFTNYADDLITQEAKWFICNDYLKDYERAAQCRASADTALEDLLNKKRFKQTGLGPKKVML